MKRTIYIILILTLVLPLGLSAKKFKLPTMDTFISDTLYIQVSQDSSLDVSSSQIQVVDSRAVHGSILGIRQTKKYKFIPVDQYLAMDQSLTDLYKAQFLRDSLDLAGTLHISRLILWTDNSAVLQKGLCLNAYSTFHDTLDRRVSDWIWEIRVKRERKEKDADYLSRVVQELLGKQSQALLERDFYPDFYPYLFRRQLMTWSEFIYFKDGYAVNVHFTLDFPPDQESAWKRGSPGLFYRKSDIHESIAISGKDQIWYRRLSQTLITQASGTFRFGFNNFEGGHIDHLEYQNLIYLNLSGQASIEYRPVYHKGLYGGLGIYTGYNILPDVIPQTELGLLIRVGVLLP